MIKISLAPIFLVTRRHNFQQVAMTFVSILDVPDSKKLLLSNNFFVQGQESPK